MRFATVQTLGGTTAAVHDNAGWHRLPAPDLSALLRDVGAAATDGTGAPDLSDPQPVLPLPTPGKVICCGLNYSDHIIETGRDVPTHPTLFVKYADTLIGPTDDISLPEGLKVDWEAELAVVIGKQIRNVSREQAQEAIFGYTVANDISIRDWQHRTLQWFQGKAWDRTTPVGPVVVTADEIDPKAGLAISCRVNGETVQEANTRTLAFDCAALAAYISTFTQLRPGDLILTGTPGGIGAARDPKWFLSDGDVVETEIEGIGTLANRIRIGRTDTDGSGQ